MVVVSLLKDDFESLVVRARASSAPSVAVRSALLLQKEQRKQCPQPFSNHAWPNALLHGLMVSCLTQMKDKDKRPGSDKARMSRQSTTRQSHKWLE